MTTKTKIKDPDYVGYAEITNGCICTYYNEEQDEWFPIETDCFGDCFDDQIEFVEILFKDLIDSNETGWWKVSNLRLWDGNHSGYFYADNIRDLIFRMAVNSEWHMRATVYKNRVEYSLSHHDAPMGSSSVVYAINDEQREELGLY